MHNDVKKILVSSEEITKREKELADEISKYYKEGENNGSGSFHNRWS